MDIVRLRTMTLKSKFTEGKFKGLTVAQVMQIGKFKLMWIYYAYERITFTDDVLDAIGVRPEQRIEKPGKDKELFNKIMHRVRYSVDGLKTVFANSQRQKAYRRRKIDDRIKEAEGREQLSKGRLQWLNQHGY